MSVIKRFVAGAVCPRCGEMDTIRVYRNEIREYRECIKCDYVDGQNLDGSPEDEAELVTRVNQQKEDTPDTQVIQIMANPNPGKKH
ncbi:YheV family putative zinc ribbon protein [Neptunomonas sp.]|uniref:YheV family putative zinc ribbon protein n=1 Tax=Neptunomonas sp. TaxID=1971898 RepID=UPI003568C981